MNSAALWVRGTFVKVIFQRHHKKGFLQIKMKLISGN